MVVVKRLPPTAVCAGVGVRLRQFPRLDSPVDGLVGSVPLRAQGCPRPFPGVDHFPVLLVAPLAVLQNPLSVGGIPLAPVLLVLLFIALVVVAVDSCSASLADVGEAVPPAPVAVKLGDRFDLPALAAPFLVGTEVEPELQASPCVLAL